LAAVVKKIALLALLCFGLTVASQAQTPVYQLRIYKLHPGNEAHFHDRFRDQSMPVMKRYGFDIVFTSQSGPEGHAEFVYLLRWKDRATQASQSPRQIYLRDVGIKPPEYRI